MSIPLIKLDFPELRVIRTLADGSCMFHSVLTAISNEYREMKQTEKMVQAMEFRIYLAKNLELEIGGKTVYDKLSRGNLKDFSKAVPEFSLEQMKEELCSNSFVDNKYNELVSNTLNVDIYLIDAETQDLYVTGNDMEILYFNRPSIVILYSERFAHYDLISYKNEDERHYIFPASHKFIVALRERMYVILKK